MFVFFASPRLLPFAFSPCEPSPVWQLYFVHRFLERLEPRVQVGYVGSGGIQTPSFARLLYRPSDGSQSFAFRRCAALHHGKMLPGNIKIAGGVASY